MELLEGQTLKQRIAGQGWVNPLAAILSATIMLENLEQSPAAREVIQDMGEFLGRR